MHFKVVFDNRVKAGAVRIEDRIDFDLITLFCALRTDEALRTSETAPSFL